MKHFSSVPLKELYLKNMNEKVIPYSETFT